MVETKVTLSTTSHGTRTNTFLNIVDLAGLKDQLQPSLIDSTSNTTVSKLLPLVLTPKCSSMATSVDLAMVETPLKSTSMPTKRVSSTVHANNILATTSNQPLLPLMNAKTAHGLHQLKVRMAKRTALPSKVLDTTSQATTR
jgi:hypothetical protein